MLWQSLKGLFSRRAPEGPVPRLRKSSSIRDSANTFPEATLTCFKDFAFGCLYTVFSSFPTITIIFYKASDSVVYTYQASHPYNSEVEKRRPSSAISVFPGLRRRFQCERYGRLQWNPLAKLMIPLRTKSCCRMVLLRYFSGTRAATCCMSRTPSSGEATTIAM